MNYDQMRSGIARIWMVLKEVGLEFEFSQPMPLKASKEYKRLAHDPESNYEQTYLIGLKNRDYNILLKDYSFFQFGIDSEGNLRYAFMPNPFLSGSREALGELIGLQEYVEEGVISIEQYRQNVSELRRPVHPPALRYEHAKEQYVKWQHPTSHFHFGHHGENRWPIGRRLTPLAFGLLVVKYFYIGDWITCSPIKINDEEKLLDELLCLEKVNCGVVPDHLFSPDERSQFFFA